MSYDRSRHQNALLIGIALLFGIALLGTFWLFQHTDTISQPNPIRLMAVSLISLLIILFFGCLVSRQIFPQYPIGLHGPVLITSWVLFGYGIFGFMGFLYPEELLSNLSNAIVIDFRAGAEGWLLTVVCMFGLWTGYLVGILGSSATSHKPPFSLSQTPKTKIIIILFFITIILRGLLIAVEGRGSGRPGTAAWGAWGVLRQSIGYIESVRYVVLALVVTKWVKREWKWSYALPFVFFEFLYAYTGAFSSHVLWLLFTVGVVLNTEKRSLSKLIKFIPVLAVLGILVVPISESTRRYNGSYNTNDFAEILNVTVQAAEDSWGQGFENGWSIFRDKVFGRQATVAFMPGVIISLVPSQIPHQGWEEFLSVPLYVIPRFMWPGGKPILSRGVWFSNQFLNKPSDYGSSSAMTFPGEAYLYAGWIGTFLAGISFGFILSLIFKFTIISGYAYLYASLVPNFIKFENFTQVFVGTIQAAVVLLLINAIITSSQKEAKVSKISGIKLESS